MTVWAVLLILSVAGMFVIILRRLPRAIEAYKDETKQLETVTPMKPAVKLSEPKPVESIFEPHVPESTTTPTDIIDAHPLSVKSSGITEAAAEEAYKNKDYASAAHMYEQLLKDDTGNAKYYGRLGLIYLECERFHDARDIFRTALKFGDQVASRHANLAMAEYALGHRLTAVRYLKRAMALAPHTKRYLELLETIEHDQPN